MNCLKKPCPNPVIERAGRLPLHGINPEIDIQNLAYIVRLDQIAAIPIDRLGETVASILDDDYTLQKAIDRLFAAV